MQMNRGIRETREKNADAKKQREFELGTPFIPRLSKAGDEGSTLWRCLPSTPCPLPSHLRPRHCDAAPNSGGRELQSEGFRG